MPVYAYPGVYVEEVSSGVKPIEAAGTSTAAFFGVAQRGPIGRVERVFNFTEFRNRYGDFLQGYYLAHAVYQFFNNGGSQCYVGRIASEAKSAAVTLRDRATPPQDSLSLAAASPGSWGNKLMVVVDSTQAEDPDNEFNLMLYTDNPQPEEPPQLLEAFESLSCNPLSPQYAETIVNSASQHIRIKANTQSTSQINGYSESGAISLNGDLLGPNQRIFRINIHGDGYRNVDLTSELEGADLTKLEPIRDAIQKTIRSLSPQREATPSKAYEVTVSIEGGNKLRIASGQKSADSRLEIKKAANPLEDAAGALRLGRGNGGKEAFGASLMRPQNTPAKEYYLLGDDTVDAPDAGAVSAVAKGDDGSLPPQDQDYIAALSWLDIIRDVSLIAIPGVGSEAVADAGMNYCRNRPLQDCFFIADMAQDDVTLQDALDYREAITTPNSYGAVYFPWLKMLDPSGRSAEPIAAPPSGFVAGLYAQIDAKRGVWKAPAGTGAQVGGAVGLATELTDTQHGILNKAKKSVCVIRQFPGAGIVLWGARTLSSDPEYKYISIRRTAIMLRVSIFNGIQWAVFEPNDEELWSQLRLNIGSFLMTLFRQNAFQGAKPSEAFFVKCDGETTTEADRNLGVVNVLVGFAPLKPAEFVVVKISQMAGQNGG